MVHHGRRNWLEELLVKAGPMRPNQPPLNTLPNHSIDWLCLAILVLALIYAVAQLFVTGQSNSEPDYFAAAVSVA